MDEQEQQRVLSRIRDIQAEKARLSSEGMNPTYGLVHVSAQLEKLDKEERKLRRSIGESLPEGDSSAGGRSSWSGWLALTCAAAVIVLTLWLLANPGF